MENNFLSRLIKKHNEKAREKRIKRLAYSISELISKKEKRILDVGSFDGRLAYEISKIKKVHITGIDVDIPNNVFIPIQKYGGENFPFKNKSFDCVLLIDVLHHTNNIGRLLEEAKRVSKYSVIIKDHSYNTCIGKMVLLFIDYLGNRFYNIKTPLNFLKVREWGGSS